MRLLLDQDVYFVTSKFLIEAGHDVVLVSEIGLSQADDEDILRTAQNQNRILVTRDRDYGNLVFVRNLGTCVIYLRIVPVKIGMVHDELERILQTHTQEELAGAFIVVTSDGYRLRKFSV